MFIIPLKVGDVGLKALGEQCATTVRIFKLSGATRVSDVGMRCVGIRASNLVELDLSGCLGLSGVGLASFGECSNGLVKLTLAKCQNLEGWAFQRLVCGCHFLEEVSGSIFAEAESKMHESIRVAYRILQRRYASLFWGFLSLLLHLLASFLHLHRRWTCRSATN